MRVTQLHRYPVKSMRGEAGERALVQPWGLAGDRRWMLIDETGECVTAREYPELLLLTPELTADGVRITDTHGESIDVATPDRFAPVPVTVHRRDPFSASLADERAHAWLSTHIDVDVRLVFNDDPTRRRLNPRFSRPTDSASFADAYPLLVATEASLAQVNRWVSEGRFPDEGPLPMARFRPNVVVDGEVPFAEDEWRRIRIGGLTFRAPKGSDRCVMTTKDPDTAAGGKEPIASLARHRRYDGAVWFGMNLIPDTLGEIAVGDEVEVLEAAESDGPPR